MEAVSRIKMYLTVHSEEAKAMGTEAKLTKHV